MLIAYNKTLTSNDSFDYGKNNAKTVDNSISKFSGTIEKRTLCKLGSNENATVYDEMWKRFERDNAGNMTTAPKLEIMPLVIEDESQPTEASVLTSYHEPLNDKNPINIVSIISESLSTPTFEQLNDDLRKIKLLDPKTVNDPATQRKGPEESEPALTREENTPIDTPDDSKITDVQTITNWISSQTDVLTTQIDLGFRSTNSDLLRIFGMDTPAPPPFGSKPLAYVGDMKKWFFEAIQKLADDMWIKLDFDTNLVSTLIRELTKIVNDNITTGVVGPIPNTNIIDAIAKSTNDVNKQTDVIAKRESQDVITTILNDFVALKNSISFLKLELVNLISALPSNTKVESIISTISDLAIQLTDAMNSHYTTISTIKPDIISSLKTTVNIDGGTTRQSLNNTTSTITSAISAVDVKIDKILSSTDECALCTTDIKDILANTSIIKGDILTIHSSLDKTLMPSITELSADHTTILGELKLIKGAISNLKPNPLGNNNGNFNDNRVLSRMANLQQPRIMRAFVSNPDDILPFSPINNSSTTYHETASGIRFSLCSSIDFIKNYTYILNNSWIPTLLQKKIATIQLTTDFSFHIYYLLKLTDSVSLEGCVYIGTGNDGEPLLVNVEE